MSAVSEQSTPTRSTSGARRTAIESRLFKVLTRRGDVVLGALIVAVIALLVIPLPTPLLDGLIATNLSASIALLMLSMNIPSALRLSTFPSLLLLTTLFRLSLNIASTKLILLNGAAGHIIDAFGRLVVGGNVIVGLVVFLIIAIVQFIVIAKGAERVAEVGARFTLDGMPGKQMSIDADLRAGLIDKEEGQRRRRSLEQESKLYGAMDGAMKFVKGDAIAGMLIAFVNIVAGIAIGVGMRGMSLGESVDAYSILSVGDGMVAQIPSLFVSIAAGIVITRVDGRSRGLNHLGVQIAQEMLGNPGALLIAAVIVSGFVLVPGLPAWPFLLLALVLASAGYLARRAAAAADATGDRSASPAMLPDRVASAVAEEGAPASAPIAVPLRLRVAPGLSAGLSLPAFDVALEREKARLGRELGLPFPGLKLSVDDTLPGDRYAIDVQEVQVSQGDLHNGNVLAFASREAGTSATADGASQTQASQRQGAPSADKGSGHPSHEESLAAHVAWVVRRHAEAFIGMQETHELLRRAASQLPDLAAEVQKAVPLQRIADVLRRLVQEGVSIRYLREICESLVVWSTRENDIVMLTEYVRVDLGRFIVPRYLDGKEQLRAIVLDADAEKALREAIQQGPSGSFLALAPETAHALMAGAESALSRVGSADAGAVVLAPMDVRRYLKKFLSSRFPNWSVLSFQELPPNVQLRAVGRLGLQQVGSRRAVSNKP